MDFKMKQAFKVVSLIYFDNNNYYKFFRPYYGKRNVEEPY